MIYEVRPMTCWTYRNYGTKDECSYEFPKRAVSFLVAGDQMLKAYQQIDKQNNIRIDYVILPQYLKELLS